MLCFPHQHCGVVFCELVYRLAYRRQDLLTLGATYLRLVHAVATSTATHTMESSSLFQIFLGQSSKLDQLADRGSEPRGIAICNLGGDTSFRRV